MLTGLNGAIDVIVPPAERAWSPVSERGAGAGLRPSRGSSASIYVDASADHDMAKKIVVNAKMRRTGICGAAETLADRPQRSREIRRAAP